MTDQPVIIVEDNRNGVPQKKRARTESKNGNNSRGVPKSILRPESNSLLDDMLYPLTAETFLHDHFRKDAVCINRKNNAPDGNEEGEDGMEEEGVSVSDDESDCGIDWTEMDNDETGRCCDNTSNDTGDETEDDDPPLP